MRKYTVAALEAELDRAYERYDQAEKDRNKWHDKAQEYKRRCELYGEQEMGVASACCEREYALPRIINADEVNEGMTVHARYGQSDDLHYEKYVGDWITAAVTSEPVYDAPDALYIRGGMPKRFDIIVLLADAPETEKPVGVVAHHANGKVSWYWSNPDVASTSETWRGVPIRPQSIMRGDLYDIHTAHGSVITGILAARNGVHNPQSGDQYRLVHRAK